MTAAGASAFWFFPGFVSLMFEDLLRMIADAAEPSTSLSVSLADRSTTLALRSHEKPLELVAGWPVEPHLDDEIPFLVLLFLSFLRE